MRARYIYRMDDITPAMNWREFWRCLDLFRRYGVRPLLGIVPDNRDPNLCVDRDEPSFWSIIRQLITEGRVEISQHGFQHLYVSKKHGLLGRRYAFPCDSEFVGLPYEVQLDKIENGLRILNDEGIHTEVWMAPSHSFDRTTLRALRAAGFEALSDGIGLYPFRSEGITFVPQQLWAPKDFAFGVWTICLHINNQGDHLFDRVEAHLKSGARIITFGEAMAEQLADEFK